MDGGDGMVEEEGLCEGEEAAFPDASEEVERAFSTEDLEVLGSSVAVRFDAPASEALQAFRDEAARCDGTDDTTYLVRDVDLGDEALVLELASPEGFAAEFWLARVDEVVLAVSFIAEDLEALDGEALLGIMVERAGG